MLEGEIKDPNELVGKNKVIHEIISPSSEIFSLFGNGCCYVFVLPTGCKGFGRGWIRGVCVLALPRKKCASDWDRFNTVTIIKVNLQDRSFHY